MFKCFWRNGIAHISTAETVERRFWFGPAGSSVASRRDPSALGSATLRSIARCRLCVPTSPAGHSPRRKRKPPDLIVIVIELALACLKHLFDIRPVPGPQIVPENEEFDGFPVEVRSG